jgi:hypothetical protein
VSYRRKAKTLDVGQRPGAAGVKAKKAGVVRRIIPKVRQAVALVVLVTGVLYAVVTPFRDWAYRTVVGPAKSRLHHATTRDFDAVRPTAFKATVQSTGNPVDLAFDNAPNTFMVASTAGREVVLTVTFPEPENIARAIVRNGARDSFTAYGRANELHVVYSTGKTADLALKDTPDPQKVKIEGATGITSVEIHVGKIFALVNKKDFALSEIEFFKRRP